MVKVKGKLKRWGNSVGIIIPKEELGRENLRINDDVDVVLTRKIEPVDALWGCMSHVPKISRKSTDALLKEIDEEEREAERRDGSLP